MAEAFPEILRALATLPDNLVLDGELVVPDAYGRSDFEEVRRRNLLQRPRMIAEAAARRPAVLVEFDLLEVDGDDLRSLPLFERRRALHAHVHQVPGVQLIEHVETHGEALFRAIVDGDHEGIVAKRLDAPYRAGKSPALGEATGFQTIPVRGTRGEEIVGIETPFTFHDGHPIPIYMEASGNQVHFFD